MNVMLCDVKCLECGKKGPEMESHNRAVKVPGGVSRCQLSSCGRFYHKVRWHRTLCPLTLTPSDKAKRTRAFFRGTAINQSINQLIVSMVFCFAFFSF